MMTELMEDSRSDAETRAESLLLDIGDDTKNSGESQKASLRKFLGDQAQSTQLTKDVFPEEPLSH